MCAPIHPVEEFRMYELTDNELDAVCGGANAAAAGVVAVAVAADDLIDISRTLNNNKVGVQIAVLGENRGNQ
jgi:hypothetical protein